MKNVYSSLSRAASVLLAILIVSACTTSSTPRIAGSKFYFVKSMTDLETMNEGVNSNNYHLHWWLQTDDGKTRYERIEYYVTHKNPATKSDEDCTTWYHHKPSPLAARIADALEDLDYGFYTCITHPPDEVGVWVEYGCQTYITHPPDRASPERASTDRSK